MKVAEMREKRAALAAQALEVASTDAAKFERIMADVDKLKSDIDRTERAEALNAELRQTARPPLESVGEVRNEKQNAEHRKAFNAFLRSGENSEQFRTYAPKLFAKEFGDGIALTEQERYFSDVLLDAADIHRQTGAWPTVSEVYDRWEQENHAAERRRIASWQNGYTFTQRDFDTLAEEESGPLFDFVSTAKNLKSRTGAFPTIGDVRRSLKTK